jgi:hypothetical protein
MTKLRELKTQASPQKRKKHLLIINITLMKSVLLSHNVVLKVRDCLIRTTSITVN